MNLKDNESTVVYGGNTLGTLQLIFLVLKLAGLVNWSWWFVFLPAIISVIITIIFVLVAFFISKK